MPINIFEGFEKFGIENLDNIEIHAQEKKIKAGETPVKPADPPAELLFGKSCTCPVCANEFKALTVKTGKSRLETIQWDLCPVYSPFNPTYYEVIMCNKCGYSAIKRNFDKIISRRCDMIREKISANFKPVEYPLVYDVDIAIERFKFALLCNISSKGQDGEKAYILMKLAWLSREKNDTEAELFYMEQSYIGFLKAYSKESMPICGLDSQTITYVLAAFGKATGKLEESLRLLGGIIIDKSANARLKDRARDLKDEILAIRAKEKNVE